MISWDKSMAEYKDYKESGIQCVGKIPSHWGTPYLFQIAGEYFVSNKDIHHQNLLSLSYGKIVRKDINTTDGLLPASFDGYQVVKNGVIVLRFTDLQNDHKSLRVGLAKEEGIITSAYTSIYPAERIRSEFLYYMLHSYDIKKVFYGMGGGLRQSLNYAGIRKLQIPLPPIEEQEQIVRYLDNKTIKIDECICLRERESYKLLMN